VAGRAAYGMFKKRSRPSLNDWLHWKEECEGNLPQTVTKDDKYQSSFHLRYTEI
jgi:hypothetical protein